MTKMTPEAIREAMESNQGVWPESIDAETLKEAGCMYTVAIMPKDYHARLRYMGNLLVQMACSFKCEDSRISITLKLLTSTLSYLINSTSFDDCKYHAFDRQEIDRRMIQISPSSDVT